MKAWQVTKRGFDHLELIHDHPLPNIESDYGVLIRNVAVGINPVDFKRCDRDQDPFSAAPFIIGADGCGTVEKIGPKVDSTVFKTGRLVYYLSNIFKDGGFCEFTVQDSRAISVVPDEALEDKNIEDVAVTFASLPVASFTAYNNICIKLGLPIFYVPQPFNPKMYKNILVTGGSGGVGGFCIQLLGIWRKTLPEELNKQVKVIALCSAKNHEYVKELGATHAIDYADDDIVDKVKQVTEDEGLDAFIDNTGGTTINWAFEAINNGGDYVSNLPVPQGFDMSKLFFKSQNVHQVYLAYPYLKNLPHQLNELKAMGDTIGKLIVEGKLKSTVSEVIKFSEIKEQLVKTAQYHSKGKVVAKF